MSHGGHIVTSGMLEVRLIGQCGAQRLIGGRRGAVCWWWWLIGWGWWLIGWRWRCISCWRRLIGWRQWLVGWGWSSIFCMNPKYILKAAAVMGLGIASDWRWRGRRRRRYKQGNMMAKVTLGLHKNGNPRQAAEEGRRRRWRRFMAVDLVVLLDDSLVAAVIEDTVADVVGRGGDGHVVAAMDSWSRCDEAL